jgi:hypothetical protein
VIFGHDGVAKGFTTVDLEGYVFGNTGFIMQVYKHIYPHIHTYTIIDTIIHIYTNYI